MIRRIMLTLADVAVRAKGTLGVQQLDIVADMGYCDSGSEAVRRGWHHDLHSQTDYLGELERGLFTK